MSLKSLHHPPLPRQLEIDRSVWSMKVDQEARVERSSEQAQLPVSDCFSLDLHDLSSGLAVAAVAHPPVGVVRDAFEDLMRIWSGQKIKSLIGRKI